MKMIQMTYDEAWEEARWHMMKHVKKIKDEKYDKENMKNVNF